jgi:hypothetical protein
MLPFAQDQQQWTFGARCDDEQAFPVLGDTMVSRIDHMR